MLSLVMHNPYLILSKISATIRSVQLQSNWLEGPKANLDWV